MPEISGRPPVRSALSRASGTRLVAVAAALVAMLSGCGTSTSPGGTALPPPTTGPSRAVTSQPLGPDGALTCPPTVASPQDLRVPQPPQGLDGNARLLPDRLPESIVLCAYPTLRFTATAPLPTPYRLARRTVATSDQRRDLVETLTWSPRWNGLTGPCTAIGGDETAYLVGARYGDAVVWVAGTDEPNACTRSSNGDFTSGAALGTALRGVLEGDPAPTPDVCSSGAGRLGDDRSLAPEGTPRVTVCRLTASGAAQATPLGTERSASVVAALRALPTRPTAHTCEVTSGRSEHRFHLVLTYDRGPATRVEVDPDCTPQVMGTGVQSDDASEVVDLVEQWSSPVQGPDPDAPVSSP